MSAAPRARSGTSQRLAAAARTVVSVVQNQRSLDDALRTELDRLATEDRSAVQALAYGTLRWWPRLERYLGRLLDKPAALAPPIRALLGVGLHQLEHSSHPAYAIVDETVEATRVLQAPRAASLANAILRRFLREREQIVAALADDDVAVHATPRWLIDRIRGDWPEEWQRILRAGNEPPPLWLRVNTRRITTVDCLKRLQDAGLSATASEYAPQALRLDSPVDVDELPGFRDGLLSVQDAAAQLTPLFLAPQAGMRILDACAAPGGKACHLLEQADVELTALDSSPARLVRVQENLQRLGLAASVLAGDATQPATWWDGKPFDRILIDAPCTATGVIRRHPDIKLLRRSSDIDRLSRQQLDLLAGLWPLLAPGGRLLYATCSILRAENAAVVKRFMQATPDAQTVELPPRAALESSPAGANPGSVVLGRPTEGGGLQILTGEAGMDGFHYACLEQRRI